MATTAEIRNKALKRLGVLGRGQTARSEDTADLDAAYVELHAKLETDGLAPWGANTVDIPAEFVDDVVSLLAFSRADEYSLSQAKYQRLALAASRAVPNMRRLLQVPLQGAVEIQSF